MKKFEEFHESNVMGIKTSDKSLWWTQRRIVNKMMDDFVRELEKQVNTVRVQIEFTLNLLPNPLDRRCAA